MSDRNQQMELFPVSSSLASNSTATTSTTTFSVLNIHGQHGCNFTLDCSADSTCHSLDLNWSPKSLVDQGVYSGFCYCVLDYGWQYNPISNRCDTLSVQSYTQIFFSILIIQFTLWGISLGIRTIHITRKLNMKILKRLLCFCCDSKNKGDEEDDVNVGQFLPELNNVLVPKRRPRNSKENLFKQYFCCFLKRRVPSGGWDWIWKKVPLPAVALAAAAVMDDGSAIESKNTKNEKNGEMIRPANHQVTDTVEEEKKEPAKRSPLKIDIDESQPEFVSGANGSQIFFPHTPYSLPRVHSSYGGDNTRGAGVGVGVGANISENQSPVNDLHPDEDVQQRQQQQQQHHSSDVPLPPTSPMNVLRYNNKQETNQTMKSVNHQTNEIEQQHVIIGADLAAGNNNHTVGGSNRHAGNQRATILLITQVFGLASSLTSGILQIFNILAVTMPENICNEYDSARSDIDVRIPCFDLIIRWLTLLWYIFCTITFGSALWFWIKVVESLDVVSYEESAVSSRSTFAIISGFLIVGLLVLLTTVVESGLLFLFLIIPVVVLQILFLGVAIRSRKNLEQILDVRNRALSGFSATSISSQQFSTREFLLRLFCYDGFSRAENKRASVQLASGSHVSISKDWVVVALGDIYFVSAISFVLCFAALTGIIGFGITSGTSNQYAPDTKVRPTSIFVALISLGMVIENALIHRYLFLSVRDSNARKVVKRISAERRANREQLQIYIREIREFNVETT